jgi:hypothetical protein
MAVCGFSVRTGPRGNVRGALTIEGTAPPVACILLDSITRRIITAHFLSIFSSVKDGESTYAQKFPQC